MAVDLKDIKRKQYDARLAVMALRRAVFEQGASARIDELIKAEALLTGLSDERGKAEKQSLAADVSLAGMKLLGAATTGLDAKAELRLEYVPTALVHLFDSQTQPLVEVTVTNRKPETRRIAVISYVEGYSAKAVETFELVNTQTKTSRQLPTFFPRAIESVNELTRATVNVEVRDLDLKSELHKTMPVWLVPRTTAPLSVLDPSTGQWRDLTTYLGAFVTPNAPAVMEFVRNATDAHPKKQLVGYQVGEVEVQPQVKAVFDALKQLGIRYVQSVIEFTRESGTANQRVRRPAETLKEKNANCIDGTLLMASLLEAISLNPAIVLIPGHAFLAWETWRDADGGSDQWKYVETTMLATSEFDDACTEGEKKAADWQASAQGNPEYFRRLALSDLRAQGITPLE